MYKIYKMIGYPACSGGTWFQLSALGLGENAIRAKIDTLGENMEVKLWRSTLYPGRKRCLVKDTMNGNVVSKSTKIYPIEWHIPVLQYTEVPPPACDCLRKRRGHLYFRRLLSRWYFWSVGVLYSAEMDFSEVGFSDGENGKKYHWAAFAFRPRRIKSILWLYVLVVLSRIWLVFDSCWLVLDSCIILSLTSTEYRI